MEKKILTIQEKIDKLNNEVKELQQITAKINSSVRSIDSANYDLTKMYGFSGDKMYYIGVGSGRIYQKPVNDEIVSLIENISRADWKTIQKINQHFME